MILRDKIREVAQEIAPLVVAHRRHLHSHPELSFAEKDTSTYVASVLAKANIEFTENRGGYGIVAHLGPEQGTGCTALRADMDALPIQEANDVVYKSQNEGVMHACGHDVHTASLLGTALILKKLEDDLKGRVRLIFQPAEELLPGGASLMIADGVLEEKPVPEGIFGQHVHPPLEVGKVGVREGVYMASADELYVTITGKGGHAALPADFVDPIAISAQLITALQQIVSRSAPPTTPTVLSFGKINSMGGATNVIPDEVKLEGTFRTLNEEWRFRAHELMIRTASKIAEGLGGSCDFEVRKGYPYLLNDRKLTRRFRDYAVDYLGADKVVDLPIRMTAEDFSYYSHAMPACFYRLGTRSKDGGNSSPVHTPTFDVDEACLEVGMGLMAWTAICELDR